MVDAMAQAARVVRACRAARTAMEYPPAALKPATRAQGYAAQAAPERPSGRVEGLNDERGGAAAYRRRGAARADLSGATP